LIEVCSFGSDLSNLSLVKEMAWGQSGTKPFLESNRWHPGLFSR